MVNEAQIIEDSSVDEVFLINGTTPPLVIQQAPFRSMYLLTVTTGNVLGTNDKMNITFNLSAFIFISAGPGVLSMPVSKVILHKIGKVLLIF